MFSKAFQEIEVSGDSAVRDTNSQIQIFQLEERKDDWPENAISIFTHIMSTLENFKGKHGEKISLRIDNETDSDGNVWKF